MTETMENSRHFWFAVERVLLELQHLRDLGAHEWLDQEL